MKKQQEPDVLPRVKNSANAHLFESKGEVNKQPSMTVPGQTMSVAEMVERYRRGLPIEGNANPIFNGEDALPNLDDLDLADRQELIEQIADQLVDVKQRLAAVAKTKKEKEELDRIEALVQERLKAVKKSDDSSQGRDDSEA